MKLKVVILEVIKTGFLILALVLEAIANLIRKLLRN